MLVVGLMALMPFGVAALACWGDRPAAGPRWVFLLGLGFWLALAGAVSVYGSHKIAVLQREAAEARQLGAYMLVRWLEAGGMGEVHLAQHRLLKRPCAIKLIRTKPRVRSAIS